MAKNLPDFYEITRDGTVICGFISGDLKKAEELLKSMRQDYVKVDEGIETSAEFVERWAELLKEKGLNVFIIERYPTSKRIVVEVIPL